jgi:hypothetical protein
VESSTITLTFTCSSAVIPAVLNASKRSASFFSDDYIFLVSIVAFFSDVALSCATAAVKEKQTAQMVINRCFILLFFE